MASLQTTTDNMLKLSKRVEYALLAMQDMVRRPEAIVSAKDVAERYSLSQAMVAKVLQQLAREGVVRSYAGVNGGYRLALDPLLITIERVIHIVDGYSGGIVNCQNPAHHECITHDSCTIREPILILQERINATFRSMTVAELAHPFQPHIQLEIS